MYAEQKLCRICLVLCIQRLYEVFKAITMVNEDSKHKDPDCLIPRFRDREISREPHHISKSRYRV